MQLLIGRLLLVGGYCSFYPPLPTHSGPEVAVRQSPPLLLWAGGLHWAANRKLAAFIDDVFVVVTFSSRALDCWTIGTALEV